MYMKRLKIAEFRARLSEFLRAVRRGESLVVMDRETPIAHVVPFASEGANLTVRRPAGKHASLHKVPLPPRLKVKGDVVALLLEERQGER
jgi:prevent-host-death family protein